MRSIRLALCVFFFAPTAAAREICTACIDSQDEDQLYLLQYSAGVRTVAAANSSVNVKASSSERETTISMGWNFYHYTLLMLLPFTLAAAWFTRPQLDSDEKMTPAFKQHRFKFLLTWGISVAADWFQGPYVFALYASFGYSVADINRLFVVGFGSSMIFGTLVGTLADTLGRKRCAMLYCVMYIISCLTKHCSTYAVLFFGRVTGGIATSLLFSCFECWMVAEHNESKGFAGPLLRYMFSMMYFVNYLVAICAGFIAQTFVDAVPMQSFVGFPSLHYGGNLWPFDLAIAMLLIALPLIALTWDENYGNTSRPRLLQTYSAAVQALLSSPWIVMLGIVVAFFEGGMYAFVINWTPALEMDGAPPVPHGLVFSGMMMCCMLGASVFSFFNPAVNPAKVLMFATMVAALSFGLMSWTTNQAAHVSLILGCMLTFEMTCGIYFPAMGALKSVVVPEHARAGVYNLFRVPLNIVVCSVILTNPSLKTAFGICTLLMAASAVLLRPLQSADGLKQPMLHPPEVFT